MTRINRTVVALTGAVTLVAGAARRAGATTGG